MTLLLDGFKLSVELAGGPQGAEGSLGNAPDQLLLVRQRCLLLILLQTGNHNFIAIPEAVLVHLNRANK
jgi:hypothetical protein